MTDHARSSLKQALSDFKAKVDGLPDENHVNQAHANELKASVDALRQAIEEREVAVQEENARPESRNEINDGDRRNKGITTFGRK